MFYISRKVGRKYGIIDTDDNVEEFYSMKDIEEFYKRGIQINGVGYINRKFVVTPTKNIKDKSTSVMLKMMKNSGSGYKGFNLDFVDDRVIALPLTKEFFNHADKRAIRGGFVLAIPDIVTELADNFFGVSDKFNNYEHCVFRVVLPDSVKVIGEDALSSYNIDSVIVNGVLDEIKGSKTVGSLKLGSENKKPEISIRVRILNTSSLLVQYRNGNNYNKLFLPDIESMGNRSIYYSGLDKNLGVFLGSKIKDLHSFMEHKFCTETTRLDLFLMRNAVAVFLDDNSSIETLDMRDDVFGDEYCTSYIFVISRNLWKRRLKALFDNGYIGESIAVGVLLYDDSKTYNYLCDNIGSLCHRHRLNFKVHLDKDTLGKVTMLELFDKLYI